MVASRLRKNHVRCSCNCVEIKGTECRRTTEQRNLRTPTDSTDERSRTARERYRENYADRPVRLIGARATDITREEFGQLELFEQKKKEKLRKISATIDKF